MKEFMCFRILYYLFIFIGLEFSGSSGLAIAQNSGNDNQPVNNFTNGSFIRDWLILGPFPNQLSDKPLPNGSSQTGFYTDYLSSIGGEASAKLNKDLTISFKDKGGIQRSIQPELVEVQKNGIIDFEKYYGNVDRKVAYAFCNIYSDVEQECVFLFGSDDGAKVWVNGMLIHEIDVGRGLIFREDRFRAKLKKGLNPVLLKISEWVREWAFAMEVFNESGYKKVEEHEKYMADFDDFLNCPLVPKNANTWNYVFGPGDFPELEWDKPYLVDKTLGKFPLQIRWYDSQMNEVEKADKPGRYAFVAEGTTANGIKIRRASTLYCMPWEWMAWAERPKAYLDYIPLDRYDKNAWSSNREGIADYAGRMLLLSMLDQKEGAILLSYLDEMIPADKPLELTNTPIIKDADYHLALKRKLLGVEQKWPTFHLPKKISAEKGQTLYDGTEEQAGFSLGTTDKLRAVCSKWYDDSKEPFNVLVARHGVIVINEAFGENSAGPITTETTTDIASVTKLITGLLFAQFVDQGLIGIDDPVGKYLPDFPVTGEKVLTLRHCFTHTSGLWGHEEWGGLHEPWMDNKIANIITELPVGERYEYNGMGYNLAGKVMEMVSGKSIFRLMRENFFDPLGLEKTILEEDLAFSCHTNARELAVITQLLLNKGSYGNLRFFSSQTVEKFLPKSLNEFYPDVNVEQGIGITWMRQPHPDAGKKKIHQDKTILSKNVIGHGSATSAIFRVDLDNDLVICQTRRRGGKHYEKYLENFLLAIEQGLSD